MHPYLDTSLNDLLCPRHVCSLPFFLPPCLVFVWRYLVVSVVVECRLSFAWSAAFACFTPFLPLSVHEIIATSQSPEHEFFLAGCPNGSEHSLLEY